MYRQKIRIGDLAISFSCNKELRENFLDFMPFLTTEERQDDCSVDFSIISEELLARKSEKYGLSTTTLNGVENKKLVFCKLDDNIILKKDFRSKRIEIFCSSEKLSEHHDSDTYIFNAEGKVLANLCFLVSQLCIENNSIIVHGAGLVRNNQAYIFLAVDEGGKTTLINKNIEHHILSDDKIFLSVSKDGSIKADATPFGTLTNGLAFTTVKGFFLIKKSDKHAIQKASKLNLLLSLIGDNFELFSSLPKQVKKQAFMLLHKAAYSAPVFHLKTNYGHIDWDYLDECVEAAEKEIAKSGIPLHKDLKNQTKTIIAQA